MATKSRIDLINQALVNLGVLAAGQTASAEDTATIDAYIDPLVEELEEREIAFVDDTDAIPNSWFLPLAIILADAAAMAFGLAGVPVSGGTPDPVLKAETRLRVVQYARPTGEPQKGEYF
jgi:hypothetical protein